MKRVLILAAVAVAVVGPASAEGDYDWLEFGPGVVNWACQPGAAFENVTYHDYAVSHSDWLRRPSGAGAPTLISGEYAIGNCFGLNRNIYEDECLWFDLGTKRLISRVSALFYRSPPTADALSCKGFNVWVSNDNVNWTRVVYDTEDVEYNNTNASPGGNVTVFGGAAYYNQVGTSIFQADGMYYDLAEPAFARYVKITDLVNGWGQGWQFSEVLITNGALDGSPAVPEPATMSLLALGSLALLRRRR